MLISFFFLLREGGVKVSITEFLTLLELLKRKRLIAEDKFADFDTRANQLTAMLTALIKSIYTPKSDNGRQPS